MNIELTQEETDILQYILNKYIEKISNINEKYLTFQKDKVANIYKKLIEIKDGIND